jgi:hypothetical protein
MLNKKAMQLILRALASSFRLLLQSLGQDGKGKIFTEDIVPELPSRSALPKNGSLSGIVDEPPEAPR